MRAHRGDAPGVEEHHPVGQADGGHPVGHHDGGGVELAAQPGEDLGLDPGVDGAGGVVEHQQPGPPHQGPGQGQALALPAREGDAPLAEDGVEPLGQGGHEPVGPGQGQGAVEVPIPVGSTRRRPSPVPARTLAATVSAKRNVSWNTKPTADGSSSGARSTMSTPPRATDPAVGSRRPARHRQSDVFPPRWPR